MPHLAHGVACVSSIQRLVDKALPATVSSNEVLKRSQLLRVGVFNNRAERLPGRLLNPPLVAVHLRQVGLATTGAGLGQSDEPRLFAHTIVDGILHLLLHPLKALIVGISECGLLLKAALIIPDHLFHGVMELLHYVTVGDVLFIQKVESRRVDVAHFESQLYHSVDPVNGRINGHVQHCLNVGSNRLRGDFFDTKLIEDLFRQASRKSNTSSALRVPVKSNGILYAHTLHEQVIEQLPVPRIGLHRRALLENRAGTHIEPVDDLLPRHDGALTVFGVVDVLLNAHELLNFLYRPLTDRNTAPHLVTIEVCVKARNAQRVDSQRALVRQLRFKGPHRGLVQSRLAPNDHRDPVQYAGRDELGVTLVAFIHSHPIRGVRIAHAAQQVASKQLRSHILRQLHLPDREERVDGND